MFSGRPSVPLSVRPSVCDSRGSFMFPRYLQYLLTDFRQTFVTSASWDYVFGSKGVQLFLVLKNYIYYCDSYKWSRIKRENAQRIFEIREFFLVVCFHMLTLDAYS